jgi:3-methyladenine DNA glycosylase Tag
MPITHRKLRELIDECAHVPQLSHLHSALVELVTRRMRENSRRNEVAKLKSRLAVFESKGSTKLRRKMKRLTFPGKGATIDP